MDVPVLTAIIGVSGTLIGAIVGGCLTTFTNFLVQKRREQAELRVGCRLIASELSAYEALIYASLEQKRWWPSLGSRNRKNSSPFATFIRTSLS